VVNEERLDNASTEGQNRGQMGEAGLIRGLLKLRGVPKEQGKPLGIRYESWEQSSERVRYPINANHK